MTPDGAATSLRRLASSVTGMSRRQVAARLGDVHRAVAALAPTAVSPESYGTDGDGFPVLYHAGRSLFESLTTDDFMEGWYGWGFYAAFDPEYVRRWYGPVVTRIVLKPDAKVLVASVAASAAPDGLFDLVMGRERERIGDDARTEEMRGYLLENQAMWVHALDRIAIEDYDVVVYSDQQVVIKSPDAVVLDGEQPPPAEG